MQDLSGVIDEHLSLENRFTYKKPLNLTDSGTEIDITTTLEAANNNNKDNNKQIMAGQQQQQQQNQEQQPLERQATTK